MHVFNRLVLYWKQISWSVILALVTCLSSKYSMLPLSDYHLLGYVMAVAVTTTWIAFAGVQSFLQQSRQWDLMKAPPSADDVSYGVSSIRGLTVDIDKYFIQKWFVEVSKDDTFNAESRLLLEDILTKMVSVQLSVDNQAIVQGCLNLYLKHLKEFRRSLKRREKYSGKIGDLYRYSHVCSSSKKAKDYFIHQLTINLLNHFINWELGNSLPYQVLVSIISKKVMTYMLTLISDPEYLNYSILMVCASDKKKSELKLCQYNRVKILQVTEEGDLTPNDLVKSLSKVNLTKIDQPAVKTDVDPIKPLDYINIKTENVKIHEPKSCRTWYDSLDFTSVPVGQDMLDMMESDKDLEPPIDEVSSPIISAKNLLDEVKHMTTLEGFKTSIKPISDVTLHNIKDFQESTVNNVVKPVSQATSTAFHKIGGFHLQDEAAGVVEGILDFGRTKIRKGLRLTGLQDSPTEEPPKQLQKKHITKMIHVKSDDLEPWVNPVKEETLKGDLKPEPDTTQPMKIPSIQTQGQEDVSPEPEYEEAADLATSIAKLRSLLEQKSSESNLSTPALSPMPPDELASKMLLESEDVDMTDGMMPSFYKFCAKTATGVIHNTLNTIKTALPGNVADCDRYDGAEKWLFVEANPMESDLYARMQKLLCERKVFCTVDTAYEAIDSLKSLQRCDELSHSSIHFKDELDDFEVRLPVTKALFDILCELFADSNDTALTREPVIRTILLLFGNYIEERIVAKVNYYLRYILSNAKIPATSKQDTLNLGLNDFISSVCSGMPDYVKYLIGEKTALEVMTLFVSSLQVQKINRDVVMQIFEIVCMKLMEGSKQMSPASE